ncbi:capsule assembly Wzi family protein [Zhongshania sp.]|uniref:capsule assembly Wzi family protein n=1 Tax=Zhongshania sp. TaxID=1971902 RepID=UPI001B42853E|nr:capsule assembly Wzi family protein [Zhongshania sp.]MBQ0796954.1 capsule assembly Wzi family protein [Zhongshania sp.]
MFKSRFRHCLAVFFLLAPSLNYAAPWIKATDIAARQHIEFLASAGIIRAPISQWPLMWGGILPDLRQSQYRKLTTPQKHAVDSLLAQFEEDSAPTRVEVNAGWADQDTTVFGGFGSRNDAPQFAGVSASFVGQRWAGELNISYDIPDRPREHRKLDQSYLAGAFGNWGVTIGAVDRWWGPGWQSSTILSNNARPVPGLSLQRNKAIPFETPILSWLGPWQLQAFMGQLESERSIPDAKLLGLRFAVKPWHWLELAASRTAQWGGDGRPEDFSTFADLILGKDNRGDSGITQENEPGNQLGGVDMKILFAVPWGSQGAYAQFIGEDESGYVPSRYIYTAGLDGVVSLSDNKRIHWFVERSDTRAGTLSEKRFNYAYEHGTYKTGYRHKGRVMGASVDSDSTIDTLGLSLVLPSQSQLAFKWSAVDLNTDGARPTGFSGSGDILELSYRFAWLQNNTTIGYRWIDDGIDVRGLDDGTETLFIETAWRW